MREREEDNVIRRHNDSPGSFTIYTNKQTCMPFHRWWHIVYITFSRPESDDEKKNQKNNWSECLQLGFFFLLYSLYLLRCVYHSLINTLLAFFEGEVYRNHNKEKKRLLKPQEFRQRVRITYFEKLQTLFKFALNFNWI